MMKTILSKVKLAKVKYPNHIVFVRRYNDYLVTGDDAREVTVLGAIERRVKGESLAVIKLKDARRMLCMLLRRGRSVAICEDEGRETPFNDLDETNSSRPSQESLLCAWRSLTDDQCRFVLDYMNTLAKA